MATLRAFHDLSRYTVRARTIARASASKSSLAIPRTTSTSSRVVGRAAQVTSEKAYILPASKSQSHVPSGIALFRALSMTISKSMRRLADKIAPTAKALLQGWQTGRLSRVLLVSSRAVLIRPICGWTSGVLIPRVQ
jgi:hypothetical protein